MKEASVVSTSPETVRVVLKVQKDRIPAWPVPSSEKNACHQNGFSASSMDTIIPDAMNTASSEDSERVEIRAAELNPR